MCVCTDVYVCIFAYRCTYIYLKYLIADSIGHTRITRRAISPGNPARARVKAQSFMLSSDFKFLSATRIFPDLECTVPRRAAPELDRIPFLVRR